MMLSTLAGRKRIPPVSITSDVMIGGSQLNDVVVAGTAGFLPAVKHHRCLPPVESASGARVSGAWSA